jgi:tetratricopeptide (TPR) repeat protein
MAGDTSVVPDLLRLITAEKVPAWQASLLALADQLAPGDERVVAGAQNLSAAANSTVRAAAVRALTPDAKARPLVQGALKDPVRLVRLDAASALSPESKHGSDERRELDEYLNAMIENPVALLRRGQDRFSRGQQETGMADVRTAMARDPLAAPLPEALGQMLNAVGRGREAAEQFERAASLAPQDARASYYAALAWAETGELARAEGLLRETTRRNPGFARAWYNLGLMLNQTNRREDALQAFAAAEKADPRDADIPYAVATILMKTGHAAEAAAALERALSANPSHELARQLKGMLQSGGR